jgi:iron complex outermembrane recepter protein
VTKQNGYMVNNARISYTTGDGRWEIAGSVKNLTNKRYNFIGFDVSSSGLTEQSPGDPRWWGLTVGFHL